jgi:membrane-associated phospholipid phosphatase
MLHEPPPVLPRVPGSVERIDIALAIWLASRRHHPAARLAAAVNAAGDQPPLLALSGAVLAFGLLSGDRRAAGAGRRMLASLMISIVIKTALKAAISRTRPNVLLDSGRYEVRLFGPNEGPWQSFPSGHVAGSVALARAVVRSYPNARRLAWAGAAAIALVQVPRGTHYPLDVVAGFVVGLVSDAIAERLESRTGRTRRPAGV